MIRSFADKRTLAVFAGRHVRGLPTDVQERAKLKLKVMDRIVRLDELLAPPGNRLEALKGERRGQHSIRINDQWRICFRWDGRDATDVEIVDYH